MKDRCICLETLSNASQESGWKWRKLKAYNFFIENCHINMSYTTEKLYIYIYNNNKVRSAFNPSTSK